jgi:hypothetical protein
MHVSTKTTNTDGTGPSRDVRAEVEALGRMTAGQLRDRYRDLFGEPSRSGNRDYLAKRLAWRIQSLAEGGLSERAKRRADELARDADLRTTLPKPPKAAVPGDGTSTIALPVTPAATAHDRLPGPGTVLTRTYRGARVSVTVRPDGFEHDGRMYGSLSAVARAVTGTQWNGHLFFGLKKSAPAKSARAETAKPPGTAAKGGPR